MKLLFLRHGIAEDARGGVSGFDRSLTQEGRDQLEQIARGMYRLGIKPDVILTSPLVRAVQTAAIVAPVLEAAVETVNELQPGCSLEDVATLLRRHAYETVMLVGHEPDFSSIATRLINADERGIVLKKAGLICVVIDGRPQRGRGRLSALLTPKMLMLMADDPSREDKDAVNVDNYGA